jgi:hypothetical protein
MLAETVVTMMTTDYLALLIARIRDEQIKMLGLVSAAREERYEKQNRRFVTQDCGTGRHCSQAVCPMW